MGGNECGCTMPDSGSICAPSREQRKAVPIRRWAPAPITIACPIDSLPHVSQLPSRWHDVAGNDKVCRRSGGIGSAADEGSELITVLSQPIS